jgi:hypothetical protein
MSGFWSAGVSFDLSKYVGDPEGWRDRKWKFVYRVDGDQTASAYGEWEDRSLRTDHFVGVFFKSAF